jgi:hypothetical protein
VCEVGGGVAPRQLRVLAREPVADFAHMCALPGGRLVTMGEDHVAIWDSETWTPAIISVRYLVTICPLAERGNRVVCMSQGGRTVVIDADTREKSPEFFTDNTNSQNEVAALPLPDGGFIKSANSTSFWRRAGPGNDTGREWESAHYSPALQGLHIQDRLPDGRLLWIRGIEGVDWWNDRKGELLVSEVGSDGVSTVPTGVEGGVRFARALGGVVAVSSGPKLTFIAVPGGALPWPPCHGCAGTDAWAACRVVVAGGWMPPPWVHPLLQACVLGDLEAVKSRLAAYGPQVSDDNGWTAMMILPYQGNVEGCRIVRAAGGGEVDERDRQGWTAAMAARCERGSSGGAVVAF